MSFPIRFHSWRSTPSHLASKNNFTVSWGWAAPGYKSSARYTFVMSIKINWHETGFALSYERPTKFACGHCKPTEIAKGIE